MTRGLVVAYFRKIPDSGIIPVGWLDDFGIEKATLCFRVMDLVFIAPSTISLFLPEG